mmetsp:Transcript_3364/g.8460  ORF Transcript_3364/g.8460 Transcript_3364/m.8460 type:complete len:247 (-) Transcript_3364:978-1718(-)
MPVLLRLEEQDEGPAGALALGLALAARRGREAVVVDAVVPGLLPSEDGTEERMSTQLPRDCPELWVPRVLAPGASEEADDRRVEGRRDAVEGALVFHDVDHWEQVLVAIDLDLLRIPPPRDDVRLLDLVLLEDEQLASVAARVVVPPRQVLLLSGIHHREHNAAEVILLFAHPGSLHELAVLLAALLAPRQAKGRQHHRVHRGQLFESCRRHLLEGGPRRQLRLLLLLLELAIVLHPILAHVLLHR